MCLVLSGVGQCQRGVELRVVAVPEAGGDRVDVHVLVPRTLEQLQVLHIPWFFAISILSWLFIISFIVFAIAWHTQKVRAAEAKAGW